MRFTETHSRHWLRIFSCVQSDPPPHSRHLVRSFLCEQSDDPPHSRHRVRCFPCVQNNDPPHSRHWSRRFPCVQIDDPPHSRHRLRRFPCGHVGGIACAFEMYWRVTCVKRETRWNPFICQKTYVRPAKLWDALYVCVVTATLTPKKRHKPHLRNGRDDHLRTRRARGLD